MSAFWHRTQLNSTTTANAEGKAPREDDQGKKKITLFLMFNFELSCFVLYDLYLYFGSFFIFFYHFFLSFFIEMQDTRTHGLVTML
jgi:hypothetical protein